MRREPGQAGVKRVRVYVIQNLYNSKCFMSSHIFLFESVSATNDTVKGYSKYLLLEVTLVLVGVTCVV
jgi:hypothetical protein